MTARSRSPSGVSRSGWAITRSTSSTLSTPRGNKRRVLGSSIDVSLDHLVFDDIARRPLHTADNALGDRLAAIGELTPDELAVLRSVIDGLLAKSRLRILTADIS